MLVEFGFTTHVGSNSKKTWEYCKLQVRPFEYIFPFSLMSNFIFIIYSCKFILIYILVLCKIEHTFL